MTYDLATVTPCPTCSPDRPGVDPSYPRWGDHPYYPRDADCPTCEGAGAVVEHADEDSCTEAQHCDHWYDGGVCCRCGDDGLEPATADNDD